MPAARNNEPLPHLTVRAALTRDLPTHAPGMASALRVHLCASSSRARVELRPGHPALRRGEGLLRPLRAQLVEQALAGRLEALRVDLVLRLATQPECSLVGRVLVGVAAREHALAAGLGPAAVAERAVAQLAAVHERESVAGHRCSPCSRRRSTQQARSEARCPATRMGTGGPARNRTAVDGFAIRVPAPLAEASSVSSGDVTAARHEGNMRAGPHEGGAVRAPEEGPDVAREVARCDGPIPTRLPAGLSEAELLRGYPPRVPHPFEVVVLGALIACSAACAMGVWPWPLPAGGAS